MSLNCIDVANYFIWLANHEFSDVSDFSPIKLQKVTFSAQGWYLGLYGEPLFQEDFQAWKYGPVYPPLYFEHKKFGKNRIVCDFECPDIAFDKERFLKGIAHNFFHIDPNVLSGMTHKEGSPWKITRKNLSSKEHSNEVIPKELIKEYYEKLINDSDENDGESDIIAQFLDFLANDAEINFDKMIPYTEDMLEKDKRLLERE